MYKARYYKADGKKGRARALPDVLFDGVVNEGVLHQVVKVYLNNQRQGTGSAKNRSAVRGGSRKPWRQKGTGRARQGSIRSVQWAGGGRAFPPIPHSWRQQVPKKMKGLARRSAFNARAEEDRVVLIDAMEMEAPKTRELREYLEAIELDGAKVLVLTDGLKKNVYLSARNLPTVEVHPFGEESPYHILHADVVVIERGAVDALAESGGGRKKKKAAPADEAGEAGTEETAPAEAAAEGEEAPSAAAADAEAEASDEAEEEVEASEKEADEALEAESDDEEEKSDG